jgi:hypothetical protein
MKKILFFLILLLPMVSRCDTFTTIWQTTGTNFNSDTIDFKMRSNGDTVFWRIWYLDSNDTKINNTPDTFNFIRGTSQNIIYLTNISHTGRVLLEIESKNLTQFSVEITSLKKIREIKKWGKAKWNDMTAAFRDCSNLQIIATDIPDLSNVTSLKEMFSGCTNLTGGNIGEWDVSNIVTMERIFANAENFNSDISDWNVSNVDDMFNMFFNAKSFNQDLSSWCMSRILTEPQGFKAGTNNWNTTDREPYWGRCAVWVGPNSSANDLFSNVDNWLAGQIPDSLTLFIQISPKAEKNLRLERNLTPFGNSINYNLININFRNPEIKVILGNFNLRLNNFSGEKFWKFKTNGDGMVSLNVKENESIRFDVGDSTFNPVTITNLDDNEIFSVKVYNDIFSNGISGKRIIDIPHVRRIWKIFREDTTFVNGVNYLFEWMIEQEYDGLPTGGFDNAHLNTLDQQIMTWEVAKTGNGVYNTGSQILNHNGYRSYFDLFAISGSKIPLPNWYHFTLEQNELPIKMVTLKWEFYLPNNFTKMEIQRFDDGEWNTIYVTKDIIGQESIFNDFNLNEINRKFIYRIVVTDEDGKMFFTKEKYAFFKLKTFEDGFKIKPNPNNGSFTISIPSDTQTSYKIFDIYGKVVKYGHFVNGVVEIDLLKPGHYSIILFSSGFSKNKNIVVY